MNALARLRARLDALAPYAFVPARLFVGLAMASHGYGKLFDPAKVERFTAGVEKMGFPLPEVFAFLAGYGEFFGGLFLAAGLFTRTHALLIVGTMFVAAFIKHAEDPFGTKERALLFLVPALGFVFTGGGRFSVDALFERWWRGRKAAGPSGG